MPNRRTAEGRKTILNQRPCGIIRVAALWPLCRYRHKGHWTGHRSRLDRLPDTGFGSPAYAREELIAEMASAFLCAELGILPTVRHADYLGTWLSVLREDSKAIFRAASQASKAADYLLAFRHGEEQGTEEQGEEAA
ncbi:antirestriction protein [Sphingobium sp. SA916]|nr:antirestriction protein [Sphingobium sp. SA916]